MEHLFKNYLQKNNYIQFDLKAVLFDMDGILYDSMPAHARSWQEAMEEFGLKKTRPEDFYLHEGRPADFTINIFFKKEFHRDATEDEIKKIYAKKSELFAKYNTEGFIKGAKELLYLVKSHGLIPVLVTGSKQPTLLDRLDDNFPNIFTPETMITAFDTKIGKPHPEPFLMGLKKGGNLKPNQALVIENAPLGTESATKAGIFTICVNTGPLDNKILIDAGANIVFQSMPELLDKFPEILKITSSNKNN
ncbi:MAG: HAD hydrolase-like protein [Petrimonas sp.]|jgi:beta-phosphoglucomutase-like phosphatase (HAD superfamily)|nr:MAG: Phosphorylated carbohydrates phosphatase [Bacteroidetes bacterium ADurb.BinA174]